MFEYDDKVYYKCDVDTTEAITVKYRFLDGETERNITCTEFGEWSMKELSCRSKCVHYK